MLWVWWGANAAFSGLSLQLPSAPRWLSQILIFIPSNVFSRPVEKNIELMQMGAGRCVAQLLEGSLADCAPISSFEIF